MTKSVLAVYGTLRAGLNAASFLDGAKPLGGGVVSGSIYSNGQYPCYKRHPECEAGVVVELYEVSADILERTDRYEGFDSDNMEGSLFIRIPVREQITGQAVFIYEWNYAVGDRPLIESGDFVKFQYERTFKVKPSTLIRN